MKTKAIIFLVLVLVGAMDMRGQKVLDTLYANELNNVALFFPSPIERAATGHEGFVFSYDSQRSGYLGLLQAVEGPDSNLLVITNDGLIYAFILSYAKEIVKLNHFVQKVENIGSEGPVVDNIPLATTSKKDSVLIAGTAQQLLDVTSKTLVRKRRKGLVFRLEAMEYFGDEVYLVCSLKNRSGIDFEIGYLDVLLVNGSQKRRASYQETSLDVKQTIGLPRTLNDGEDSRFVVVLSKFVLGDRERLKLILGESRGNRRLVVVHG